MLATKASFHILSNSLYIFRDISILNSVQIGSGALPAPHAVDIESSFLGGKAAGALM
jgi:hypothetical protein